MPDHGLGASKEHHVPFRNTVNWSCFSVGAQNEGPSKRNYTGYIGP